MIGRHIDGPWKVEKTVPSGSSYDVRATKTTQMVAIVYSHGGSQANADLIAAAPELMKALTDLVDALESWDPPSSVEELRIYGQPRHDRADDAMKAAHAAIAKARGGVA